MIFYEVRQGILAGNFVKFFTKFSASAVPSPSSPPPRSASLRPKGRDRGGRDGQDGAADSDPSVLAELGERGNHLGVSIELRQRVLVGEQLLGVIAVRQAVAHARDDKPQLLEAQVCTLTFLDVGKKI